MPAAICHRLRTRRLGFFVPGFSVNDTRDLIFGILPHPFPDAHHVSARRVYEEASLRFELLPRSDVSAERRDNHNIILLQIVDIGILLLARKRLDSHRANLIVHLRVMNNLSEYIDWLLWINF